MTVTLELKPEIEEQLVARARAAGLSTEEFVNRELERLIGNTQPPSAVSPEERARFWEEWIASHSTGGPPLSDYAVSRESIYSEREDAQL